MHLKYFSDQSDENIGFNNRWGAKNPQAQSRKQNLIPGVKILKFKNEEAYVYGETQLIYFSDIREHMKIGQQIELILMNVDGNTDGPMYNTISKGLRKQEFNTGAQNNAVALSQFQINRQRQLFPPMINTLYLEREIEEKLFHKKIGQAKQDFPSGE